MTMGKKSSCEDCCLSSLKENKAKLFSFLVYCQETGMGKRRML